MKYLKLLVLPLLIMATFCHAQQCGNVVDEANIIHGTINTSPLVDQGALVHVVTLEDTTAYGNLTGAAETFVKNCPDWQATDHHPKPNLFLVFIALRPTHQKQIFYGGGFGGAFKDHQSVDYTFSQAANPYFKHGDFVGGINASIKDFASINAAFHDQKLHPVQKTTIVNNQATDFHGLWTILGWLLGISIVVVVLVLVIQYFNRKHADAAAAKAAQQDAIRARGAADSQFTRLDQTRPDYADLQQQYLSLSNSVQFDPSVDGLSADDYKVIARDWRDLVDEMSARTISSNRIRPEAPPAGYAGPGTTTPSYQQPAQQPVVVNNNNSGDMLTGMLIGEELGRSQPQTVYEPPVPSYDPPSSDDDDDRSFGSSDSSSWSDSSSSDFGSSDSSGW